MKLTAWILAVLAVSLGVAALLSPFASSDPDGLEASIEQAGLGHKLKGEPLVNAPLPDYTAPGIQDEGISTAVSGIIGTLVTFGVMGLLAWLLTFPKRRREQRHSA